MAPTPEPGRRRTAATARAAAEEEAPVQQRSLFEGIPPDELRRVLTRVERRSFPSGSVVLAEGDSPHEAYVVESGAADVFVADSAGEQHRIGYVTPGGTLGEMSLLTGEPAAGTVRATTDLDVYAIGELEFDRLATEFPVIYRNLGAILSERLDRSNRLALTDPSGHVTVLRDWGAPPLLGYAIAASVSWHLRAPVLLIVLDEAPPGDLRELARSTPRPRLRSPRGERRLEHPEGRPVRADVSLMTTMLDFVAATLTARLEDFYPAYEHVLVQVMSDNPALTLAAPTIHLAGASGPSPENPEATVVRAWAPDGGRLGPQRGAIRIPTLDTAAEEALRHGALPPTSAAGAALGWIARDLCGLKVGVALGGGSAKGYAHIGVLRTLLGAGMPIDYIAGTSIGAAVAAIHALGLVDEATEILDDLGPRAFRPRPSTRSLLSMWSLSKGVRAMGGDTLIEDLRVPLAVTAADVSTGQEVIFRHGLLWPAVIASMAIPGIFPAQRIGERTLVDGGVFNPVPTNIVAELGADLVVGVRLAPATESRVEATAAEPDGKGPSILYNIMRSIEMMQGRISATTASAAATILIAPIDNDAEERPVGLRRWKEARKYVPLGEAAAAEALPRLAAALPWMRG
jgi:predicted acylesterase/phospholipase RssA